MNKLANKRLQLTNILLAVIILFSSCEADGLLPGTSRIDGVAYDAITFQSLEGADVYLKPSSPTTPNEKERHTFVDKNGKFEFKGVTKGIYNLYIENEGYKHMFANNVDISNGDAFVAFLPLTTNIPNPVGGVTGIIRDKSGNPIADANIAISAQNEELTNGYFSSVCTNAEGQFYIGAVPLQTTKQFKVRSIALGYETQVEFEINIQPNEMVVVNFFLEEEIPANKIFFEDFENGTTGWELTGMWRLHENSGISNSAFPKYVKLPPNDKSEGRLPDSFKGRHMLWYGDPAKGNYMGEQSPYDYDLSGGTGLMKSTGSVTSSPINLAGVTEASLNFWTWFEIESVNPNHLGYDLMMIYVVGSDGNKVQLGKLNPYTDPIIPDRKAIPFTSGGFNQSPVWKFHEFDLTPYVGSAIKIIFEFDTRDGLYNGFRGWFIDDISITDKAVHPLKSGVYTAPPLQERNLQ